MNRIILGIILGLAAAGAYASGNNNQNNSDITNNYNTTNNYDQRTVGGAGGNASASATGGSARVDVDNKNTNVNTNVNSQSQKQGQVQGQQQGQIAVGKGGNATNAGNSQSTMIEFKDRLQPGAVAVAATTTTASCRVAVSGGVSFPGGAVGFGSAYKDDKCDKRALGLALIDAARVAASIGSPADYYAPIFEEGMALLRASGEEQPAEEKSAVRPTGATQPAVSASLNP